MGKMDVRDSGLRAGLYPGFVHWIVLNLDTVSISYIFNLLTC